MKVHVNGLLEPRILRSRVKKSQFIRVSLWPNMTFISFSSSNLVQLVTKLLWPWLSGITGGVVMGTCHGGGTMPVSFNSCVSTWPACIQDVSIGLTHMCVCTLRESVNGCSQAWINSPGKQPLLPQVHPSIEWVLQEGLFLHEAPVLELVCYCCLNNSALKQNPNK